MCRTVSILLPRVTRELYIFCHLMALHSLSVRDAEEEMKCRDVSSPGEPDRRPVLVQLTLVRQYRRVEQVPRLQLPQKSVISEGITLVHLKKGHQ